MVATLDGLVEATGAVFEAKFMLPWSFSEEAAAEKYMAQVQHNMWVTHSRVAVLSIITGGSKWVEHHPHGPALSDSDPARSDDSGHRLRHLTPHQRQNARIKSI
jgi:hypothetical protein